jgi:hypothetical protein
MNTPRAFFRIAVLGVLLVLAGFCLSGFTKRHLPGKTITTLPAPPRRNHDNRVKSIVPYLRKYIPKLAIVVQYMDGRRQAGG